MNELDQRLHHAARRLREMPVDMPPLDALGIATPTVEPPALVHRRTANRVPAGVAVALLMVGGIVGFAIGHRHSAPPAVGQSVAAATIAPTPADRMRDPLVRRSALIRPADEVAMLTSRPGVSRRHVRWS